MKVLVLGSGGRLGGVLVPYLRLRGHDVLAHARARNADVTAELTDSAAVAAALTRVAPDVVVNLAAVTDVDECERRPQAAFLANVRAVENVVEWITGARRPCHLIQVSTDQIYDGPGPHTEDDVTVTNYYGFSKYAGELAAAAAPSTVLRTNFFGPSRTPGRASISDWIVTSLGRGDRITVFEDVLFSPLSMARVAEAIGHAVLEPRRGVFNLGSRSGMSKADFAFALAAALDLPVTTMTRGTSGAVKLRAYRPKDMRMDCTLFESTFAVHLPTLLDEITSMKAAYAAHVH